MYSNKVQKIIDNYVTHWNMMVIDTMGVEYKIPPNKKIDVIRLPHPDIKKLYNILYSLKNSVVIFDRIDIWCFEPKYQEYYDIFSELSVVSKKNNLLIFT